MSKVRGFIGRTAAGAYDVAFMKPGKSYPSANRNDYLFHDDSAAVDFVPLVQGSVLVGALGNKNVPLPKRFTTFPIIFCQMWVGGGRMYLPCKSQFFVQFHKGANFFTINNRNKVSRRFYYAVFDNATS